MAKVSLRAYNHEIEGMIEGGQLNEAVAHCQHILKTYSMHVETYRLLGKAFLENRRYADAADIFQRALMAVPDDFVAHVGMSIIRDDENKLDEAIWHMERAFEVQPSNPAIQGELRRLYGRRDGVEPPKIRLSRDALANMYSQGELFNQAIAEIRAVLAEDANRPDLQVMLARAYYRGGKKVEAAEMAAGLLKKYPYCLDALRILVDVLPGTAKGENTQVYQQRLRMLDPYSAFSKDSAFMSNQVSDSSVTMEKLEYHAGAAPASGQPNWASNLGIKLDAGTPSEDEPVWLPPDQPVGQPPAAADQPMEPIAFEPLPAEPQPAESQPAESPSFDLGPEQPAPANQPEDDSIPEWMRTAGWQEASGHSQEQPPFQTEAPPAAEPIAAAEIPDWLKSMAPPGMAAETGAAGSEPAQPSPEAETATPEEVPDWLKKVTEAADHIPPKPQPEGGEVADTQPMKAASLPPAAQPAAPAAPDAGGTPPTAAEQDAAMAWLESLAAKQGAKEEELLTKPEDRSDELPDWIQQTTNQPAFGEQVQPAPPVIDPGQPAAQETMPPAVPIDPAVLELPDQADVIPTSSTETSKPLSIEDDTMAWLENLAAKQGAKPEELLTKPEDRSDTPPEWIQKAVEAGSSAPGGDLGGPSAASAPQEIEAAPSASVPPEAVSAAPEKAEGTAQAPQGEDLTITSWLSKLDVEEAVNKAQASRAAAVPAAEDLPEWLQGMDKAAPAPETAKAEENAPDWLAGAAAPQTPGPAPVPEAEAPSWMDQNTPVAESSTRTVPEEWLPMDTIPAADSIQPSNSQPAADKPDTLQPPSGTPSRPTGNLSKAPAQDKDADLLSGAQAALNGSQLKESMQAYAKLVKKGKLLEEVIHDLREAIYRFPVDIIVWQTLGDAYMRANRLQEALDAYNKAEELLR